MLSTSPVVSVSGLLVNYGGDPKPVLEEISFSVPRGSVYALLGRNGAGKSSLVRCLLGQQKPSAGELLPLRRGRVETADAPDGPHRRRARGRGRAARDDGAPAVGVLLAALPDSGTSRPSSTGCAASRCRRTRCSAACRRARRPSCRSPSRSGPPPSCCSSTTRRSASTPWRARPSSTSSWSSWPTAGTTVLLTSHDLAGVEKMADRVGILKGGRLAPRRGPRDAQGALPAPALRERADGGSRPATARSSRTSTP